MATTTWTLPIPTMESWFIASCLQGIHWYALQYIFPNYRYILFHIFQSHGSPQTIFVTLEVFEIAKVKVH